MRVLITGAAGFVGRHLATHLLTLGGDDVWGLVRRVDVEPRLDPRLRLTVADLLEPEQVAPALAETRPEAIYHLAGLSSVASSLGSPLQFLVDNVACQVNLLEAVAGSGFDPRILIIGSSEEYGLTQPDELPITETKELRPISPYAVSKVTQDLLGHQYFATRGLKIVRVRPFTHTGPGQSHTFVTASFARQIAEMELRSREPVLRVGLLQGQRDFTDVRDVARGYRLILAGGEPGQVYNLGSERPRSIESVLNGLVELSAVRPRVEVDQSLVRPLEVPAHYADCSRLRAATGWQPEIPFDQTLADVLDDWRHRVRTKH